MIWWGEIDNKNFTYKNRTITQTKVTFAGMTAFSEIAKQGIPSVSSGQITQPSFGG
jgi:hypothetical protein